MEITKAYILQLQIRKICKNNKCKAKNTVNSLICRVCKRNKLRYTRQKKTKK